MEEAYGSGWDVQWAWATPARNSATLTTSILKKQYLGRQILRKTGLGRFGSLVEADEKPKGAFLD